MKVFLAGGTGAIGRHALPALLAAGHEVSALVRSNESAKRVEALGAAPVFASLFERDGLTAAVAGHDAVVNLATAIPPTSRFMRHDAWTMNERIRREGAANLVDAGLAAGAKCFIQESVVMIYGDGGAEWLDESWPTDHFPIAEGNHAAEASARRFAKSGAAGIVLRFGWFYGPGATHSEEFFDLASRRRICIMIGPPGSFLSSIHVEDAGAAVAAALCLSSGTFNVVDDEPLTKRAYADALAAAAGRSFVLRLPGRLAVILGDRTTSLTRSVRASNKAFRQATGWKPKYPSAREGWRATAAALSD